MMRMHSISHRLLTAYLSQPYEFFLNRHTGEMSTRVLAETRRIGEPISTSSGGAHCLHVHSHCDRRLAFMGRALGCSRLVQSPRGPVRSNLCVQPPRPKAVRICTCRGEQRPVPRRERGPGRNKGHKAFGSGEHRMQPGMQFHQIAWHAQLSAVLVLSQVPQLALQAVAFGGVILLCLILMDPQGLASGAALGGILPTLGVFAFAGQRLMPELSKLYQSLAQLQAGAAAVEIVHDDLLDKAGSGSLPRAIPTALGLKRRFEFENVSYRYPNAEMAGLTGVSFDFRAGERIGIVGSTGAGKTTLADLVLGLLQPSEGSICADGTPITDANLRAWQQSVGYVPQDIFLTDASITENIALGVPVQEIDAARVRHAARNRPH